MPEEFVKIRMKIILGIASFFLEPRELVARVIGTPNIYPVSDSIRHWSGNSIPKVEIRLIPLLCATIAPIDGVVEH